MELISVTKDLDTLLSGNELGDWVSVWRDDLLHTLCIVEVLSLCVCYVSVRKKKKQVIKAIPTTNALLE